ncbi:MAG TPA: hypothetical protein VM492_06135 [Sumerlaeia bacterium]|nr:hypothetical protein [Sumerlaeia bacterium]
MRRLRTLQRIGPRGFTLIEMLIIAALITLFSFIAIFSAERMMRDAKRKSTIADGRSIADGLTNAHFDNAFFPKIGYLSFPKQELWVNSGAPDVLPPGFDVLGFDTLQPRARAIYEKWGGPYLPNPKSRGAASQTGVGYVVTMRIPGLDTPLDWPADPYGNPYIVYLVGIDDEGYFDWIKSPSEEPDYRAIVVSYGSNGIPGGRPTSEEPVEPPIRQQAEQDYMLYRRDETGQADFVALSPDEYTESRLRPLEDEYLGIPGIQGTGSDDIVAPIR